MTRRFIFKFFLCFAASVLPFSANTSNLCAQGATASSLPEAQIREVLTRILKNAGKANCKPPDCKILVANFTLPSGLTSQLGIQLADQFSKEIASQQTGIQIIGRSTLRPYLERERIPGALLNSGNAMRWLGKQLGGSAVLAGLIENNVSPLRVRLRLLSCGKDKASLDDEFILPPSDPSDALIPVEAFPQKPPDVNKPDSTMFRAGASKATQPQCNHCPDPAYTKVGRDAKFEGTVLMEAVLSPEGRVIEVRIVRGIPYGLNQEAISAVQNWKFKPATFDGKPVAISTMIEIRFRASD